MRQTRTRVKQKTYYGSLAQLHLGSIGVDSDIFLTKFDPTGNELWSKQFGAATYDSAVSVVIDNTGNVYVGGVIAGYLTGASDWESDAVMYKFDPSGIEWWSRQIGTSALESGGHLSLDLAGNAYLAGSTRGNLGGPNAGDYDIYLAKLYAPFLGDLDGDGFVGIDDLNIVLGNWNQNVPPGNPLADPSGDGFVGIEDLNVVLGNWNAGTPPATGAVPEPSSLALLTFCGASLLRRIRSEV